VKGEIFSSLKLLLEILGFTKYYACKLMQYLIFEDIFEKKNMQLFLRNL
jgi:hypothetical protein